MDWAVYDIAFSCEGRRRVNLFSYVLGYSRRQYLCFTERQDFDATVGQHIQAFRHLQGLAATCLYDNMKVVVTRWEDDHPIYNTRFLAFATHYGYRPQACRPRRPQTKGKVERPFHYVELSLLNGRTFRSLEHLNEVTRWWLANVADVRIHRTTKKRPVDAYAEEQPHLLALPEHDYDTARVVYRVVDSEGCIAHEGNQYSVPWQRIGEVLPVRVTETELFVYDHHISQIARHTLSLGQTGKKEIRGEHRPPKDHHQQVEELRRRFQELGEIALRFLEGLLKKQRYGKRQAQRVLALASAYHRQDVLAAMQRAVRYHAYSLSSLERILNTATPKASWQVLSENQQELMRKLTDASSIEPRSSAEYQYLLFDEKIDSRWHRSKTNDQTLQTRILQHLTTLNIPLAAEQLDEILSAAAKAQLSHLQLLERFLSVPANLRQERSIERRIRAARFRDENAAFESFDWEFNRKTINRAEFEELGTGDFIRRRDNLAFVGESGLGKSHLIQAIGRRCCVHGYRVRYVTSAGLLEELTAASGDKTLSSKVRYYSRFDLLVIDEFGFDKLERREYPESPSLLYKVIDSRSRRGSTAMVTNVDFKEWTDYLGDPPLVMAILDRLVDDTIIQRFEGKSYRAYRAEQKAKQKGRQRAASQNETDNQPS